MGKKGKKRRLSHHPVQKKVAKQIREGSRRSERLRAQAPSQLPGLDQGTHPSISTAATSAVALARIPTRAEALSDPRYSDGAGGLEEEGEESEELEGSEDDFGPSSLTTDEEDEGEDEHDQYSTLLKTSKALGKTKHRSYDEEEEEENDDDLEEESCEEEVPPNVFINVGKKRLTKREIDERTSAFIEYEPRAKRRKTNSYGVSPSQQEVEEENMHRHSSPQQQDVDEENMHRHSTAGGQENSQSDVDEMASENGDVPGDGIEWSGFVDEAVDVRDDIPEKENEERPPNEVAMDVDSREEEDNLKNDSPRNEEHQDFDMFAGAEEHYKAVQEYIDSLPDSDGEVDNRNGYSAAPQYSPVRRSGRANGATIYFDVISGRRSMASLNESEHALFVKEMDDRRPVATPGGPNNRVEGKQTRMPDVTVGISQKRKRRVRGKEDDAGDNEEPSAIQFSPTNMFDDHAMNNVPDEVDITERHLMKKLKGLRTMSTKSHSTKENPEVGKPTRVGDDSMKISGSKHFGGNASASRSSRVALGENKLKLNESVTEQGAGGFTGNYSELKDGIGRNLSGGHHEVSHSQATPGGQGVSNSHGPPPPIPPPATRPRRPAIQGLTPRTHPRTLMHSSTHQRQHTKGNEQVGLSEVSLTAPPAPGKLVDGEIRVQPRTIDLRHARPPIRLLSSGKTQPPPADPMPVQQIIGKSAPKNSSSTSTKLHASKPEVIVVEDSDTTMEERQASNVSNKSGASSSRRPGTQTTSSTSLEEEVEEAVVTSRAPGGHSTVPQPGQSLTRGQFPQRASLSGRGSHELHPSGAKAQASNPEPQPREAPEPEVPPRGNAETSKQYQKQSRRLPSAMDVVFSEDELIDLEDIPSAATTKKRRKRAALRPAKKVVNDANDENDSEDDADGKGGKGNSAAACRLGFYKGKIQIILKKACDLMRIYLYTTNGFPTPRKLVANAKKFYKVACQQVLGAHWKTKMPEFTNGMSRLIRHQNWVVRGNIKKAAIKIVDLWFELHPDERSFKTTDPKKIATMRRQYREQRVAELLGPGSLYICGQKSADDDIPIPFTHMAIAELVFMLVFCKKSNKKPIASVDFEAFTPIPLPLMAYASTAICAALEDYKSGNLIPQKFSEAEFKTYYLVLLKSLHQVQCSKTIGWALATVRRNILSRGRREISLGSSSVAVDMKRPPAPYIPSSDNEGLKDFEVESEISDSELE